MNLNKQELAELIKEGDFADIDIDNEEKFRKRQHKSPKKNKYNKDKRERREKRKRKRGM